VHPSGFRPGQSAPIPEEDLAVSERAAPQYCPYCGDEDLRPEVLSEEQPQDSHGVWLCRACARVFRLNFVGLSSVVVSKK
jgi:ribosomal protein L37AE/L43A